MDEKLRSDEDSSSLLGTEQADVPLCGSYRLSTAMMLFVCQWVCYVDRANISIAIMPMAQSAGWTETQKGMVLSSFFYGYLVTQVPMGWLAARYGGKWPLIVSVCTWSLFTVLTPPALSVSFMTLLAVRVSMGLGFGVG